MSDSYFYGIGICRVSLPITCPHAVYVCTAVRARAVVRETSDIFFDASNLIKNTGLTIALACLHAAFDNETVLVVGVVRPI